MRRGAAAGSGGLAPDCAPRPRPPPTGRPASPIPTAILGVLGPSFGGGGTWAAGKGASTAVDSAPAPSTSIAVLRVNFMRGVPFLGFGNESIYQRIRQRFVASDTLSP